MKIEKHFELRRPAGTPCAAPGCSRAKHRGPYCLTHSQRLRKHGDLQLDRPVKRRSKPGSGGISRGYRRIAHQWEHRLVMERLLRRPLVRTEVVHHKNYNPLDNRPENLELMTPSQHSQLHGKEQAHWRERGRRKPGIQPYVFRGEEKRCARCHEWKAFHQFNLKHGKPAAYCLVCHADYQREWRKNRS